jgi:hypothetical protein
MRKTVLLMLNVVADMGSEALPMLAVIKHGKNVALNVVAAGSSAETSQAVAAWEPGHKRHGDNLDGVLPD